MAFTKNLLLHVLITNSIYLNSCESFMIKYSKILSKDGLKTFLSSSVLNSFALSWAETERA